MANETDWGCLPVGSLIHQTTDIVLTTNSLQLSQQLPLKRCCPRVLQSLMTHIFSVYDKDSRSARLHKTSLMMSNGQKPWIALISLLKTPAAGCLLLSASNTCLDHHHTAASCLLSAHLKDFPDTISYLHCNSPPHGLIQHHVTGNHL